MKACNTCQQTAALPPQHQKKLQPILPPNRPWKHIGIDLIIDLPEIPDGYKHILVTVCYLSKYVMARALKQNILARTQYKHSRSNTIRQHAQVKEYVKH